MAGIRFGTMSLNYPDWVGPFYRPGSKAPDFLPQYSRVFTVAEIDSTWYRTPSGKDVEKWNAATPAGFQFLPKLVRSITHEKCFVDVERELEQFVEVARLLGPKLGPILIQTEKALTPVRHAAAVARFLESLPKDLTFAIEFRNKKWYSEETNALLRETGVAWTAIDGSWIPLSWGTQLLEREPTGKCVYVRLLYQDRAITDFSHEQVDRSEQLAEWAAVIAALQVKVPVYVLVNNHYEGHSPGTIRKLQRLLDLPTVEPSDLQDQPRLL